MTLWRSSEESGPGESMLDFTSSLDLDRRLYPYDIRGSIAWARALERLGVYEPGESQQVVDTLNAIKAELDAGELQLDPGLEDIHMNIEAELTERLPELGSRLHTGRSRNDQVLVDVKLYLKDCTTDLETGILTLLKALLGKAEGETETPLPGATHLQPAQPVSLSHYLLAFFEKFRRDYCRLQKIKDELDVLPLGSGALAGSGFKIDRQFLADQLDFARLSRNSLDAVSERDFMLDYLHSLTTLALHASRLAEDWITWSTPAFDFCQLAEQYTTGSSIMPQKKNPDALELIRGRSSRLFAAYQGMASLLKAQPLAYNRDLQEDKFHLFRALDALSWLKLLPEIISTTTFNRKKMAAATEVNFLAATDLADYLVEKGEPFRRAHNIVRELVEKARRQEKKLSQLDLNEYQSLSAKFEQDIYDYIDPLACMERRDVYGGTAPRRVRAALAEAGDWLQEVNNND